MKFMHNFERKFGKYAISNLMKYIIILYVVGWFISIAAPEFYMDVLMFNAQAILHGQVWRLITFIIAPPSSSSAFFMIFTLYLYYVLGTNLERYWGAFKFNLYFFMGILFHIVAGFLVFFIFGVNWPISTYYLNMSLFFAFAAIYPNMELLLFFILPIKIKWLAILDGIYFGATIFFGFFIGYFPAGIQRSLINILVNVGIIPLPQIALVALVSILNFLVFFLITRNYKKYSPKEVIRKSNYKRQVNIGRDSNVRHTCEICGRTSITHPDLTFRYCSKCSGNHEYCQDHLFTHEHIK